jgi:hypothetical protein
VVEGIDSVAHFFARVRTIFSKKKIAVLGSSMPGIHVRYFEAATVLGHTVLAFIPFVMGRWLAQRPSMQTVRTTQTMMMTLSNLHLIPIRIFITEYPYR